MCILNLHRNLLHSIFLINKPVHETISNFALVEKLENQKQFGLPFLLILITFFRKALYIKSKFTSYT